MERLTCEANKNLLVISANMKIWRDIYKKLTAYEDTGLEPEQVAEVYRRFSEARAIAEELGQKYADRADELLRAEAEGHLLVLPCKVGKTVYAIKGRDVFEAFVVSFHWHEWQDGFEMGLLFDHRKTNGVYNYPIGDWGKTVFSTREEAEAKLKECGNE